MEILKGHTFNALPAVGLQKIFDLLEYDGPILSHFKDVRGNNFLFYWVDNNETVNRWLVWRVTELQLYQYLRNEVSLKDLMEEPNKEYIYSVEIDSNLNYHNVVALELYDLPQAYKLEESLFFDSKVPALYEELFRSAESDDFYFQRLKETGLYFNIKPTNRKFRTIVSASEGADFLYNISKSLSNFAQVSFFKNFSSNINDYTRLKKVMRDVIKATEPQLSYAGISSFEVGVSIDVTQVFENGKYKNWQDQLIKEFETKVVNIDYSDKEQVQNIIDSFEEEDRIAIYGPYLKIIENDAVKVEATNYHHDFKRIYSSINKNLMRTIIPEKPKAEKKEVGSTFAFLVVEIPEDKGLDSIDKRNLTKTVSFEKGNDASFFIEEYDTGQFKLKFKKPFAYGLKISGSTKIAYCDQPLLEVSDPDSHQVTNLLFNEIGRLYLESTESKTNLDFWNDLIEYVLPSK